MFQLLHSGLDEGYVGDFRDGGFEVFEESGVRETGRGELGVSFCVLGAGLKVFNGRGEEIWGFGGYKRGIICMCWNSADETESLEDTYYLESSFMSLYRPKGLSFRETLEGPIAAPTSRSSWRAKVPRFSGVPPYASERRLTLELRNWSTR